MRVVPPLEINTARLINSNVAEPSAGETAYNASTSYAVGARVISTATHRTYESLVAGNVGNALTDITKWADVGPTNRYAMFDHYRSTATVRAGGISVTIKPGVRTDALALLNINAVTAEITITSGTPATTVYARTIALASRNVASWSEFFFTSFTQQRDVFLFDLPPYSDAEITITLTGALVSIGSVVAGMSVYLGPTLKPSTDAQMNFSKIDRDEFGDVHLVRRRSVPTTELTVKVAKENLPRLRNLRDELNAVPALWAAIDDAADPFFAAMLRYGIYKRFDFELIEHDRANAHLTLEEL